MKKTTSIIAAIILTVMLALGLGVLSLGGYGIGLYNQAKTLNNQYSAKISANKADFDNVTKVISQTAQVSKAQLDKLREIYNSYAEARTGKDASKAIMNWVQESVPNVDTTTMNNLQNIIVSSRNGWTERQKELVDISREYNLMLEKFPSNVILGFLGFKLIDPLVITSSATEEAFETKKDDNIKLDF